ncbi:hypothetical protein DSECCO2_460360 [anaerobic digester metagenome]
MLRRDPGEDLRRPETARELVVGHRLEVGSRQRPLTREAQILCDGGGGQGVVPRYHDDVDTGAPAEPDSLRRFRAWGIYDPGKPEEDQVFLDRLRRPGNVARERAVCRPEYPEPPRCIPAEFLLEGVAEVVGERHDRTVPEQTGREVEEDFRRSLHVSDVAVALAVDDRHPLPG